jgi:iron complex outermembrane recepter protein
MKTTPPLFFSLLLLPGPSWALHADDPPQSQTGALSQGSSEKEDSRRPVVVETVTVSASVAETGRDPASFATLDRGQIATANRGQDLAMLLGETPNAYAYSDAGNGIGYSYLSLRGFDQRRIAILVNGVPLNEPESHQVYFIDLADLASGLSTLQVQRGTGTALYGSPAVGGLANLDMGALAADRQGELRLGFGSFGTTRMTASYASPLGGGRSSVLARVSHVRSDGYRDPAWTRHTFAQVSWQRVGDDSVLRVHAFGGPEKTQLAFYGVPVEYLRGEVSGDAERDRRVNPLLPGETDTFFQPHVQVLHDWRLRDGLLLKTALYAIVGDGYFRQHDGTFLYDPMGVLPPTAAYPESDLADTWRKRSISNRRFGVIPTLSWEHGRGQLVTGFELMTHRGHHEGRVEDGAYCAGLDVDGACAQRGAPIAAPLLLYDYVNRKQTARAFVRETWRATPELRLSAELQVTHHAFSMREDVIRDLGFDTSYTFVTPRVGVNWNPSERLQAFVSFSTARSEPTFPNVWDPQDPYANPASLFASFDPAARRFSEATARPERLQAWETGLGYRTPKLGLSASLYWMDFRDELIFAGGLDDDGLPITDNAARSLHKGIELQGYARVGDFRLDGHLAASHDELEDYVQRFGPAPEETVDYSGNRVALFPTHTGRLRLAYEAGRWRAGLGVRRVGRIYLDNSENERKDPAAREAPGWVDKAIEPYTLADAELAVRLSGRSGAPGLRLELHVDNLFDERYSASGYVYGVPYFYPAATRSFYAGFEYAF